MRMEIDVCAINKEDNKKIRDYIVCFLREQVVQKTAIVYEFSINDILIQIERKEGINGISKT